MPTTAEIEEILTKFDVNLSNFEIINIEEKKGWSSKFLFLIVEHSEQYVLKGKSKEQLVGYLADIAISDYLNINGFTSRKAIKTNLDLYHFEQSSIFWELKTYIPGSVSNFSEYTDDSIISLARVNTAYINTSLNKSDISKLGLDIQDILDIKSTVESFNLHKSLLTSIVGKETQKFADWFGFAQNEISKFIKQNTDFSIIHNDLNNKNILLDLHTNKVTSFIDWDHGVISSPLKDILEPINTFYDYVPEKYEQMRTMYLKEISSNYDVKISASELNLLQLFLYALNKWKYISFFITLIENVGDTTNELAIFEDVVSSQLNKLNSMGKLYKVF